jgi:hypothetical protein
MLRLITRVAPIRRILTAAEPDVMVQLVRLIVLYEDLKVEVAGLHVPHYKEFDEVSQHYREMYFVRRAFATLREMDSALHKLNMLKEFKARRRSLDRRRLRAWTAAIKFFSKTKKFIASQRNAYGGHVNDDLARFVLGTVEQTDDTVGALEIRISDDHTNRFVFKFAETIVSNALFVDRGESGPGGISTRQLSDSHGRGEARRPRNPDSRRCVHSAFVRLGPLVVTKKWWPTLFELGFVAQISRVLGSTMYFDSLKAKP